jgi:hypothetical protein
MSITMHKCPTCGAKEDERCRTPKGRLKPQVHSDRPFSVEIPKEMMEGYSDKHGFPRPVVRP